MKTIPLLRAALALVAVALAATGGGCSTYQVKFDAIARVPTPGATPLVSYKIHNANPAVADDSLRFKEAAQTLKTALSGHGLWEAPDTITADMVVEFDYGVDAPRIVYEEVDVPVLPSLRHSHGGVDPSLSPATNSNSPIKHASSPPADGEIGFAQGFVPVPIYEKYLTVSCRENKPAAEGRPPSELWRISVSLESEGHDLRTCLPILAAVVMEELGTTTAGETIRTMNADDESIRFIKKGL